MSEGVRASRTPNGVWVIVGMAVFFVIGGFRHQRFRRLEIDWQSGSGAGGARIRRRNSSPGVEFFRLGCRGGRSGTSERESNDR